MVVAAGAFFTTYEAVKYTLGNTSTTTRAQRSNQSQHETINRLPVTQSLPMPIVHAIASSSAEMVSCLMLTPAEVLKQNAQVVQMSSKEGSGGGTKQQATRQVIARFRHKPWKLWSGYSALVGRNLPFTGLHFPMFEYVRSHIVDWRDGKKRDGRGVQDYNPILERAFLTGLSAGISGTIAAIVTTPIDVVKTRVMLAASDGSVSGVSQEEKKKIGTRGTLDVRKEIYQKEGVRGLFRGGLIRAAWTAVSISLYLSIYEGGRFYLEDRRKNKEEILHKREGGAVI